MKSGIIFGSRLLDVAFIAMFIAQFYKVVAPYITKRKFEWDRIIETGGMPSSHSSTVTSLATSIYFAHGYNSAYFAIVVVFGSIVMYDATGIRRAAGRHAGLINEIFRVLRDKGHVSKERQTHLKELLGHEPIEVLVGGILGIIVAYAMRGYILA